jgi:probable HAF family extracellular repeat protein
VSLATRTFAVSSSGLKRLAEKPIALLSTTIVLAALACSSEDSLTEPSIGSSATQASANTYAAVDLGTLGGGSFSVATAINPAGQVVGFGEVGSGATFRSYGFIWQNGVMTDLGSLGGRITRALDINARGQVVGTSSTADGLGHAFVWQKGTMFDLGPGQATAINPAGLVVGTNSAAHAALWEKGRVTDLGTLGGCCSQATGINPAGQVVGASQTSGGDFHAFLWQKGVMLDLGTLGGTISWAEGITPSGKVIGWSSLAGGRGDGQLHAFLWENGVMTDLGTLGGSQAEAFAINPRGQVVGSVHGLGRAFLWDKGGVAYLGTLGGSFSSAEGINPAGQVVGRSETADREVHATLWRRQ